MDGREACEGAKRDFCLYALLAEVLSSASGPAAEEQLTLKYRIALTLPPAARGDVDRVRRRER